MAGMTHVRTAPYYPQSNGKLERWHKTVKVDALRVSPPSSLEEARAVVARFVAHYNEVRLHSAIGYITPAKRRNPRSNDHRLSVTQPTRRLVHAEAVQSDRFASSVARGL